MSSQSGPYLPLAIAAAVVALLLALVLLIRLIRLQRMLTKASKDLSSGEPLALLMDVHQRLRSLADAAQKMDDEIAGIKQTLQGCVQHVGLVRFDAFEDVGGRQSFALAILDARQNGVIVTGIYSRTDVRFYAKRMELGKPSVPLTDEEERAVGQALGRAGS